MDLNVTIQDLTVKHKVHDMDLNVTVQDLTVKHKVHDMDLYVTVQDLTVKHKVHDMDLYVTVQDLTVKHKVHVQHGIVCQVMDILSTFCHEFMNSWFNVLSYSSLSSSFLACNSRLHGAIRRHHPPQRAVLSQICCFGERKMVLFQILLNGAEPRDPGTTWLSSPVCRRGG